jgi:hypothetical protein
MAPDLNPEMDLNLINKNDFFKLGNGIGNNLIITGMS